MVISRSFIKLSSNVNLLYYLLILPLLPWELISGSSFKDTRVFFLKLSTCSKTSFCWHCYSHVFQAHVFSSGPVCAAFLSNSNSKSAARVTFRSRHYNLPPWSISILPDCKNDVFNTAKVHKVFEFSVPLPCSYKWNLKILKHICCISFWWKLSTGLFSAYCIDDFILWGGSQRASYVSGNDLISPQRPIHQRILSFTNSIVFSLFRWKFLPRRPKCYQVILCFFRGRPMMRIFLL